MPPLSDEALNLLVVGFDGPDLPGDVAALLARGLGGVALFRRNLVSLEQVRDLCRAVHAAAAGHPPPIVSVDQEGGRVQRMRHLLPLHPTARELGAAGPEASRAAGRSLGADLAAAGFNLDFAPVLDVDSNPANPVIGDRSFGPDPDRAAACALAFLEGLEAAGVRGCGKHFPGHGDASLDSHLDLPVIDAPADVIDRRELVPFRAAVDRGIGMIMSAHCVFPALDPALPATLSRAVLDGILRRRLGFEGVVVTDDLGMKAIADRWSDDEVLRLGLDAGVDLFLQCGAAGEGIVLADALLAGLHEGLLPAARVLYSIDRVRRFRATLSRPVR